MGRKDYYYDKNVPKPNSIVPAASAVVYDPEGKILLHKRKDNSLWSLPGGGMKVGESVRETIIREVKEETGLEVEVKKCIGIYTDPNHVIAYDNGEIRQQFSICFECQILGGELSVSEESHQVGFFTLEEIEHLEMHPAQKVRINDYLQQQEKTFVR